MELSKMCLLKFLKKKEIVDNIKDIAAVLDLYLANPVVVVCIAKVGGVFGFPFLATYVFGAQKSNAFFGKYSIWLLLPHLGIEWVKNVQKAQQRRG